MLLASHSFYARETERQVALQLASRRAGIQAQDASIQVVTPFYSPVS